MNAPPLTPWRVTLRLAGVPGGRPAGDYAAAARLTARRYPAFYPALRLLCPPGWQPHVLAVAAFGIEADSLADLPAHRQDPARYHAWADRVRTGLETGRADAPSLRAFLHTVAACGLAHPDVREYLACQAGRFPLTGYATEQDHEDHLDGVVLPLLRMTLAVCGSPADPRAEAARLRPVADAVQRADDLADLAADLRRGMLTIPRSELLRCGVTRADLEDGRDTAGVRAVLARAHGRAAATLAEAHRVLETAPDVSQVLCRPSLLWARLAIGAAGRRGAALTRRGVIRQVRPSPADLAEESLRSLAALLRVTAARSAPR
ncbi:squalene/phytoene synthase family protein [Streptomyces sp. DSM 44917]|uniref:Squalene/phytoene synthase family protein n=1 Tax=Streptomyces boetiae TaxID=3075541 RepID=A0ABU2L4Z3_9ACTN|nr:squalene/phytoene synthase family protein [Streptomyces sp. DSM 44917]MDT0306388.1 squalene/phytoene synthase family protein [Streptomyces sp. DSM 44917]